MTTQTFFRRRISKEIRRFSFLIWVLAFGLMTSASADTLPSTVEGRINRNLFPAAKYQDRFSALPPGAESALRARIDPVLKPIGLAPASWFRSSFEYSPSVGDRKRILESLKETEIWKCIGDVCRGCGASESGGCVLSEKGAGGIGVVAVIHPCLIGEVKCAKNMDASVDAWAERVVAELAFYKLRISTSGDAFRSSVRKSSAWIHSTAKAVNSLLGACPGPFPVEGVKFLRETDSLTLPNAALKKCGQTYLRSLTDLNPRCSKLTDAKPEDIDVIRCDSFCRKMLCRTTQSRTIFTKLGGRSALLLLDGGCEGEKPLDLPGFLRDAFPRKNLAQAEAFGCIPKGAPVTPGEDSAESGISHLGNGNEVQLVE